MTAMHVWMVVQPVLWLAWLIVQVVVFRRLGIIGRKKDEHVETHNYVLAAPHPSCRCTVSPMVRRIIKHEQWNGGCWVEWPQSNWIGKPPEDAVKAHPGMLSLGFNTPDGDVTLVDFSAGGQRVNRHRFTYQTAQLHTPIDNGAKLGSDECRPPEAFTRSAGQVAKDACQAIERERRRQ